MPGDAAPWTVTSMGNASVLIEIGDALVLTDPFFGVCPGIVDAAELTRRTIPDLTAIVGSHWARDHWEMDGFADYPHKGDHCGLCRRSQHGRQCPRRRLRAGRDSSLG